MTTKTMHHSRLFLPSLAAVVLLSGCMNRVESMKETLAFAWSGNQDVTVTQERLDEHHQDGEREEDELRCWRPHIAATYADGGWESGGREVDVYI